MCRSNDLAGPIWIDQSRALRPYLMERARGLAAVAPIARCCCPTVAVQQAPLQAAGCDGSGARRAGASIDSIAGLCDWIVCGSVSIEISVQLGPAMGSVDRLKRRRLLPRLLLVGR